MPETLENNIDKEAKKIATNPNLASRIQKFAKTNNKKKYTFITFEKSQHNYFLQNTPCRLINSSKTEMSKQVSNIQIKLTARLDKQAYSINGPKPQLSPLTLKARSQK